LVENHMPAKPTMTAPPVLTMVVITWLSTATN